MPSSLSLAYGNGVAEKEYIAHRRTNAAAADRFKLAFLGVVSVVNLSVAAYVTVTANPLWWRLLRALGPHSVVYGCHLAVSHCSWYQRRRTACAVLFEVLYMVISISGIPKLVAASPTNARSFIKNFVIGSGSLLGLWYSAFTDKPWRYDMVMVPLEYLAFAYFMVPPTCDSLTRDEYGRQTTLQLLAGLRSCRGVVQERHITQPDAARYACSALLYVWVALWCAFTLYGRHRLELQRRIAFSPAAASQWRMTPPLMQVLLHMAVACVGMSWLVL